LPSRRSGARCVGVRALPRLRYRRATWTAIATARPSASSQRTWAARGLWRRRRRPGSSIGMRVAEVHRMDGSLRAAVRLPLRPGLSDTATRAASLWVRHGVGTAAQAETSCTTTLLFQAPREQLDRGRSGRGSSEPTTPQLGKRRPHRIDKRSSPGARQSARQCDGTGQRFGRGGRARGLCRRPARSYSPAAALSTWSATAPRERVVCAPHLACPARVRVASGSSLSRSP
jgi:hypothetical protein